MINKYNILIVILLLCVSKPLHSYDKFLGSCIGNEIPSNFESYFTQVTPENAGKWGSIEKKNKIYDWATLDNIYDYTINKNFIFKFHTLIWGQQQPEWLKALSKHEQKVAVEEWIQAACQRYSKIDFIDVVNEPINHPPFYKEAMGGDGLTGYDWLIWVYEEARLFCPNSKLLINEYNILNNEDNLKNLIKIVKLLNDRGIIDGIGIQAHYFEIEKLTPHDILSSLSQLSTFKLPIYISEIEIDEKDDSKQLKKYQEMFPVFWEYPLIQGVTLWGYLEGKMWKVNGYLIRTDGTMRPAFEWLMDYINK